MAQSAMAGSGQVGAAAVPTKITLPRIRKILVVTWFRQSDGSEYILGPQETMEIEVAYLKAHTHHTLTVEPLKFGFYSTVTGFEVKIDPNDVYDAIQINTTNGNRQALKRVVKTSADIQGSATVWEYEDFQRHSGVWRTVSIETCDALSWCAANKSPAVITANFGGNYYVISAQLLRQINVYTKYVRVLRRHSAATQPPTTQVPAVVTPSVPIKPSASTLPPNNPDSFLEAYGFSIHKCDAHTRDEDCPICLDCLNDESDYGIGIVVDGCHNHGMHIQCLIKCIDTNRSFKCPTCQKQYGAPQTGNMPTDGTMRVQVNNTRHLSGHPKSGTIVIQYRFPDGTQGPEHPFPGQRYTGTSRTAYLPNTREGNEVLRLFKIAWERRLLFQVNESITQGPGSGIRVVWNGIHHKTNISGSFGYPDPNYLQRVTDELKFFGVE